MPPATDLTKFLPPVARELVRKRQAEGKERRKRKRISIEELNQMSEEDLAKLGKDIEKAHDPRSTFTKVLDVIDVPRNAVANVIGSLAGVDKSKLRQGTLLPKVYASDILEKLGWKPTSTGGKVAKGVVGFLGDVVVDPLTYVGAVGHKVAANAPKVLRAGTKSLGTTAAAAATGIAKNVPEEVAKAVGRSGERLARIGQRAVRMRRGKILREAAAAGKSVPVQTAEKLARKAVQKQFHAKDGGKLAKWMSERLAGKRGPEAATEAAKFFAKHGEKSRTVLRVPFVGKPIAGLPGKRKKLYETVANLAKGDPGELEKLAKFAAGAGAAKTAAGSAASATKKASEQAEAVKRAKAEQALLGPERAAAEAAKQEAKLFRRMAKAEVRTKLQAKAKAKAVAKVSAPKAPKAPKPPAAVSATPAVPSGDIIAATPVRKDVRQAMAEAQRKLANAEPIDRVFLQKEIEDYNRALKQGISSFNDIPKPPPGFHSGTINDTPVYIRDSLGTKAAEEAMGAFSAAAKKSKATPAKAAAPATPPAAAKAPRTVAPPTEKAMGQAVADVLRAQSAGDAKALRQAEKTLARMQKAAAEAATDAQLGPRTASATVAAAFAKRAAEAKLREAAARAKIGGAKEATAAAEEGLTAAKIAKAEAQTAADLAQTGHVKNIALHAKRLPGYSDVLATGLEAEIGRATGSPFRRALRRVFGQPESLQKTRAHGRQQMATVGGAGTAGRLTQEYQTQARPILEKLAAQTGKSADELNAAIYNAFEYSGKGRDVASKFDIGAVRAQDPTDLFGQVASNPEAAALIEKWAPLADKLLDERNAIRAAVGQAKLKATPMTYMKRLLADPARKAVQDQTGRGNVNLPDEGRKMLRPMFDPDAPKAAGQAADAATDARVQALQQKLADLEGKTRGAAEARRGAAKASSAAEDAYQSARQEFNKAWERLSRGDPYRLDSEFLGGISRKRKFGEEYLRRFARQHPKEAKAIQPFAEKVWAAEEAMDAAIRGQFKYGFKTGSNVIPPAAREGQVAFQAAAGSPSPLARQPLLRGTPIPGAAAEMGTLGDATRDAARIFPNLGIQQATWLSGIGLPKAYRGKGIGQAMFLDAMDAVSPGWLYGSQASADATKALEALAKKGHIELWSMAGTKPTNVVSQFTKAATYGEEATEAGLMNFVARISDKGRAALAKGGVIPAPAEVGARAKLRAAIEARRAAVASSQAADAAAEPLLVVKGGDQEAALAAKGYRMGKPFYSTTAGMEEAGKQGAFDPLLGDAFAKSGQPVFKTDPAQSINAAVRESAREIAVLDQANDVLKFSFKINPLTKHADVARMEQAGLSQIVFPKGWERNPLRSLLGPLLEGRMYPQQVAENMHNFLQAFASPETSAKTLKAIDGFYRFWKPLALMHPAYWSRNVVQGTFGTIMVSGLRQAAKMHKHAWSRQTTRLYNALVYGKDIGDEAFEFGGRRMNPHELLVGGRLTNMGNASAASELIFDSVTGTQRLGMYAKKPLNLFFRMNNATESRMRIGLWFSYLDDGMSMGEAAQKVLRAMPDLSDLTYYEREFGRRIFPWFSWMRRNLGNQVYHLARQPGWLAGSDKLRHGIEEMFVGSESVPEELRPKWMQEQQAAQILGDSDKGYVFLLASWLPFQDMVKLASGAISYDEGIKAAVEQMRPEIKFIMESATGQDIFRRQDINTSSGVFRNILPALVGVSDNQALNNLLAIRPARETYRVGKMPEVGGKIARAFLGGATQRVSKERGLRSEAITIREKMQTVRSQLNRARENADTTLVKQLAKEWIRLNARARRLGLPVVAKATQATLSRYGMPQGEPAFAD